VDRQNVEEKTPMGQYSEWEKRRLGQNIEDKKTSTGTKRQKVKVVDWNKRKM
jgi:hypothetical protein